MSDTENTTDVREQTDEVEVLGVMVKPVMKTEQRTLIDAVVFTMPDGEKKVYKIGDEFVDAFGETQKILRLKAQYADKTVALVYKEEDYKDKETGMTFVNEFMFVIAGLQYECQVHDEIIESMDKKATVNTARFMKQQRLAEAQEKERLEKEAADKAAAESSTANQEGVEPDSANENTTDDVEQKPDESDGENS